MLPAYAGMILILSLDPICPACAPRVCGDDPAFGYTNDWRRRVLPAYAGMIRLANSDGSSCLSAPRVCGDDPYPEGLSLGDVSCSPRMRG